MRTDVRFKAGSRQSDENLAANLEAALSGISAQLHALFALSKSLRNAPNHVDSD
jgi:hypothetical protein